MIKKENQTREIEVVKDVICNKCGNSCEKHDGHFSYAVLTAEWGYFSDNRDGEIHEAHLCQTCWENIIKDFKHSDLTAENQY